jgi:hypothetical protein
MDATHLEFEGFSARIQMELRLNGVVLSISHLGPDFLILDDPIEHPPAEAEIMMSVDARERRWPVYLPAGVSPTTKRTRIARP